MSREVNREADAHDDGNHGDGVQVDTPESHVANHTRVNWDDAQGHPQRAQRLGYEEKGNQHHARQGNANILQCVGQNDQVLIPEKPKYGECGDVAARKLICSVTKQLHGVSLLIGRLEVAQSNGEPVCSYPIGVQRLN